MANLNQTNGISKMKITEVITERKTVEKEVNIPYYFKDEYSNLCKVISTEHFISARADKDYWAIQTLPVNGFKERIAKGTPITEDDYNNAYEKALNYLQSLNYDSFENEEDENVKIDEIIYGGRL